MEFYLKTQPDVPYHLNEISCTACNHRGVSLDFRATLSVREAVYFVTCRGCKRQFPEKSSLEAFE
jgi:transcription elongation factor Elf1